MWEDQYYHNITIASDQSTHHDVDLVSILLLINMYIIMFLDWYPNTVESSYCSFRYECQH